MGIEIPLRADAFANPTEADVAVVAAYMLWPHDPVWIDKYVKSTIVDRAPDGLKDALFDTSKGALPVDLVWREIEKSNRRNHGILAGCVLIDCLAASHAGHEEISKGDVIAKVISGVKKTSDGGLMRISKKTFDNTVWKNFACAAHLWAAYVNAVRFAGQGNHMPCRPSYLRRLIEEAEGFRLAAEQCRMKQSKYFLLIPGETLVIPSSVGAIPANIGIDGEFEPHLFQ